MRVANYARSPNITHEQIERYRADGFLIIENVLSADELDRARGIVDDFNERSHEVTTSNEVFDLDPGRSSQRPMVRRLKAPARLHPFFDQLIRSDALLDPLQTLIGAWPLTGEPDLAAYNRQIMRGEATDAVRLSAGSARIPLPLPQTAGTIFEMQAGAREKAFTAPSDL